MKNGTVIAKATSIAGLRSFTLGAQLGTTSYRFIVSHIKPSKTPKVYNTNALAVEALKSGRIDGLVVDLPTALYVTAVQVPHSKVLGQFATTTSEHFGMVLQKGSPLVACLNKFGFQAMKPKGSFFLYVRAPKRAGGAAMAKAEDASQWLIAEKLISTVPWDDAGAYVRFSVTFTARDEADERRVLAEIDKRLAGSRFEF